MPGVMQLINKAIGPAEMAGAIGATIADPALAGSTIPMAFQALNQMQSPGGVLGANQQASTAYKPNFPSFSAAPQASDFFSSVPSSAATGATTFPVTQTASSSPDLINAAINSQNPATASPFSPWSVAA